MLPETYHGTYSGYTHYKCREECCLAAHRDYSRKLRRLTAYGKWNPFVDAEPARDHVKRLRAAGIGERAIAAAVGVSSTLIARLLRGDRYRGTGPTQRLRPETAARIFSVQPSLDACNDHAKVDGTGTRRRIQALVANGWSQQRLSIELGMPLASVNRIVMGTGVNAGTAKAVRALYERLWDTPPPESTTLERTTAKRARSIARRHGWVPPLAWDAIDDPAAEPVGAGYRPPSSKLPSAEEIRHLLEAGEAMEQVAIRFGASVGSVQEKLRRSRKEEVAA